MDSAQSIQLVIRATTVATVVAALLDDGQRRSDKGAGVQTKKTAAPQ
jgi:hypothetical protein